MVHVLPAGGEVLDEGFYSRTQRIPDPRFVGYFIGEIL